MEASNFIWIAWIYWRNLFNEIKIEIMKSELKHLSGYLPYELKFKTPLGILVLNLISTKKPELWFKFGFNSKDKSEEFNYQTVKPINYIGKGYNPSEVKPIFHPISDLLKHCDDLGLVPIDFINKEYNWDYVKNNMRDIIKNNDYSLMEFLPKIVTNKLQEWHFDIYGLIPAGLAIDINTI